MAKVTIRRKTFRRVGYGQKPRKSLPQCFSIYGTELLL